MARTTDYPRITIGKLELNRNPENVFAEVEQSIFSPAHFVPGIGPSPDKMLQGRLFAYGDAHRYRVGINADHLPVNRPHATEARNGNRDGFCYDGRHKGAEELRAELLRRPVRDRPAAVRRRSRSAAPPASGRPRSTPRTTTSCRPGNLYRLMSEDEKERLIANLAGFIAKVSRDDIAERAIANFAKADEDYGKRLSIAVSELRK